MGMFTQGGNIIEDMKLNCLLKKWMVRKVDGIHPNPKGIRLSAFLP